MDYNILYRERIFPRPSTFTIKIKISPNYILFVLKGLPCNFEPPLALFNKTLQSDNFLFLCRLSHTLHKRTFLFLSKRTFSLVKLSYIQYKYYHKILIFLLNVLNKFCIVVFTHHPITFAKRKIFRICCYPFL